LLAGGGPSALQKGDLVDADGGGKGLLKARDKEFSGKGGLTTSSGSGVAQFSNH